METQPTTWRGSEISDFYCVPKTDRKYYEKMPALSPKKQRPQSILKRRADPPKAESKVSTNEAKAAKGPVKTSAIPETSSGYSRKPETKKQEEEENKPVPLPAPVEPPLQGGHYELNARMTRMVETELRDIMIKVWHELPDNPSDDAEALVVDKLRNQAGDDLRNVLGLNITKRLLNVHNPLYVKVQFSGKPEKVHLGEFLKKYNFVAFKRIEKSVNMFAAQVKTINDFDRICSAKDIRCGEIRVTVTPIYKFTKCPPNLVTNFYDQEEDASDETAETTEKDEKSEEKTENVTKKPKEEDNQTENAVKADKVVSKPVENKAAVNNKPTTENKTAAEKPVENKPISKPAVETKAVKQTVENNAPANKSKVVNKPVVENKTVNKPAEKSSVNMTAAEATEKAVSKPAVQTKPAVVNKPVVNKPAVENKSTVVKKPVVANKPAAENKVVAKPAVENKPIKKPQTNPKINDTVKKPVPLPTVKTPVKTDKTKKVDDYDELDDYDILALMSEGIVLDECSGSDDE